MNEIFQFYGFYNTNEIGEEIDTHMILGSMGLKRDFLSFKKNHLYGRLADFDIHNSLENPVRELEIEGKPYNQKDQEVIKIVGENEIIFPGKMIFYFFKKMSSLEEPGSIPGKYVGRFGITNELIKYSRNPQEFSKMTNIEKCFYQIPIFNLTLQKVHKPGEIY